MCQMVSTWSVQQPSSPPAPAPRATEHSIRCWPQLLPFTHHPQTLGIFPLLICHWYLGTHYPPLHLITGPRQKDPAGRELKPELLNSLSCAVKFWGNAYMLFFSLGVLICILISIEPTCSYTHTHSSPPPLIDFKYSQIISSKTISLQPPTTRSLVSEAASSAFHR